MINSGTYESELRRLNSGPYEGEQVPGIGIVKFVVRCDGDSEEVLATAVSVLKVVCNAYSKGESESVDWRASLANRFLSACADEKSAEEAEQWLQQWQALSEEQRNSDERSRAWSLNNWLYWFEPAHRLWHWWNARILDVDSIHVSIAVDDWPFGFGAISWLFRGSGAIDIAVIEHDSAAITND